MASEVGRKLPELPDFLLLPLLWEDPMLLCLLRSLRLGILVSLLLPAVAVGQVQFACLPTCDVTDGRLLVLASDELQTFNGEGLAVTLGARSDTGQIEFGIFDGDVGENWDLRISTLTYSLYADPTASGVGTQLVAQWNDADFLNNEWVDLAVAHDPAAQSPGGNYFYRLLVTVETDDPLATTALKIRTPDSSSLLIQSQPLPIIAPVYTEGDLKTVFPNFPDTSTTTYDGSWELLTLLDSAAETLTMWDGDMDFGSADCVDQDLDDPDTPGDPFLVPWAAPNSRFEGVAEGRLQACGLATGDPSDDLTNFPVFQRSPSVQYSVETPDGSVYWNTNPSGNLEWEGFTITTNPSVPADFVVDSLPPGTYKVRIEGLDLMNLASIRLPFGLKAVCEDGTDCAPVLRPGGEGCTPGYWKQKHHFDSWASFEPSEEFNAIFSVLAPGAPSLLRALMKGGGQQHALHRHAVAALLNASTSDVSYFFGVEEIIDLVQEAHTTGEFEQTKDLLAAQNEQGCPLS